MKKQLVRLVLVLTLLGVGVGTACRHRHHPAAVPAARLNKVEYFKQTQAATMTPHGVIDMSSIKETPDGVEYRTSDGSTWRVALERTADGYRVRGEPESVK
jgi:hypothetical protein